MWEKQRTLERMKENVVRIGVPALNDVLLRRGRGFQRHISNVRYRRLIEEHSTQYESASKIQKKELTEEVLRIIKEASGRFLKEDSAGWAEVGDDVARFKVSHAFRSMRKTTAHNNKDGKNTDHNKKSSEQPYKHSDTSDERESSDQSSKRVKRDS